MATLSPERQTRVVHRYTDLSGVQNNYNSSTARAAVKVPEYPARYPNYYPRPAYTPKPAVEPEIQKKVQPGIHTGVHKKQLIKSFWKIAGVFAMCFLMIYRYAVILESNDQIDKLNADYLAAEATNQAIQAKIDRGLELGALEEYATTELGMVRPDSAHIFYVDMQLENSAKSQAEEQGSIALQGTPGALVNAIRVLK